jgi:S-DNA-T family DNA segregation ATPase FtsK/SpoIIIE
MPTKAQSNFAKYRTQEAIALGLFFTAIFLCLAFFTHHATDPSLSVATASPLVKNSAGLAGSYVSDIGITYLGLSIFWLPIVFFTLAFQFIRHKNFNEFGFRLCALLPMLLSFAALCTLLNVMPEWPTANSIGNGGLLGKLLAVICIPIIGYVGTLLLMALTFFTSIVWWSGYAFSDVARFSIVTYSYINVFVKSAYRALRRIKFKSNLQIDLPLFTPAEAVKKDITHAIQKQQHTKPAIQKPIKQVKPAAKVETEKQTALPLNLGDSFSLPALNLLDEPPTGKEPADDEALQQNARRIEAELANYGVQGKITRICPGPVITIYELEPAAGVKSSQVINLADDLARSMAAMSIRIATVPGRNAIGIEMPNLDRGMVTLRELLATEEFETHPGKLAVALGVDTSGNPAYADISKMPHSLIAGTTGSGKSVAMNAFIISLLYRMTPEQLKFVMIDPKMLELSVYNDIPHLITPVIIDPQKANNALKWVVREMEQRYRQMTDLGVKNIQSFNQKFAEYQAKDEIPKKMVQTGFDPVSGQPTYEEKAVAESSMPYIVVVIDELADLMMVAGKEVEHSIARIAQMARAAGIHLLVATQRPSVDVVTGLIKANIPTRFSFNVTSKIDSRTVLDSMGAEQLLGKGDMLYMANGSNGLERLHGAFVSEEECHAISKHLREQSDPQFIDITKSSGGDANGSGGGNGGVEDDDPLYLQAVEVVAREQKASTSFIQRHLKIGYNRAASIIDKMESDGLVGEANHVGKREVIIKQPPQGGY